MNTETEKERNSDLAISALEKTIEDNHNLRKENSELSLQLNRTKEKTAHLLSEISELKKEAKDRKIQLQKLEHSYHLLQTRYEALSHSKLGRITLYLWKKKAASRIRKKDIIESSDIICANDCINQDQIDLTVVDTAIESTISDEQLNWFNQYLNSVNIMPESTGFRFYKKLNIKIGIICDQFFYDSIYSVADFVYLTPDNWENELRNGIDVFLFVTAWRGLNDEWKGIASLSSLNNKKRLLVLSIIDLCKRNNIPTIFYSKEDPPNYELFLDIAKKSDYIFTSASECIPYYKKDCDNENADSVMFGINPVMHNPIGIHTDVKSKTVIFSGSWMKKYPDRCKELSIIFDGILSSDYKLHIIDRNLPQNKNYIFPEPYYKYSSPAVEHDKLQKLHKLFDWAIDINSVKTSETMFANRGFELSACGVLMLSNYSVGVNNILPHIFMIHDENEVVNILANMTSEDIYEHQIFSIRSVLSSHTCFDRISELLSCTNFDTKQPIRRILVIAQTLDNNFISNFQRQTYPYKEFILQSELTEQRISKFDMITWFSEKSYYGEFYLEDMINAFKYTSCNYITKDAWIQKGKLHNGIEHNYVKKINDITRTVFWREAFPIEAFISHNFSEYQSNGYSIDHFSYDACPKKQKEKRKSYVLSVIIPIYNNGLHLYGKCFTSLKRSSIFNEMEIIFIDDGSTDDTTIKIENYLSACYDNIKIYRFDDKGSGSASRPRNKGVEIATSDYITFLDPDNEAINDGYSIMLSEVKRNNYDLIFGNMLKCTDKTNLANYYEKIVKAAQKDSFDNGFEHCLTDINFLSISIQAMIIRKSIIIDNHIEQVVGAAGQDTLFSWQLLQIAKRIKAVNIPIHVYYAQTSGSVTNQVKKRFFEKLLLLQQPKLAWLIENGYIDDFMKQRYDYYTVNWILKRLCGAENIIECIPIVKQILDVYNGFYKHTNEIINNFITLCEKKKIEEAGQYILSQFPTKHKRPMPTLEEIFEKNKKNSIMDIVCTQSGGVISFENKTKSDEDCLFNWVILLSDGAYQKIYTGKYSKSNSFDFDFSKLSEQVYKIRAFIMNSTGEKKSEDIAFVRVKNTHEVEFMVYESKAKLIKGEE